MDSFCVNCGKAISFCVACGDVIDYCPGHGELGDPEGFSILQDHDNDIHKRCHPYGCEGALEIWTEQNTTSLLASSEQNQGGN